MSISFFILDSNYSYKELPLLQFLEEGNSPSNWKDFFQQPEIQTHLEKISSHLSLRASKTIYPDIENVFRIFYSLKVDDIKVIILGMDPYYNGSAVGIAFSVKTGN